MPDLIFYGASDDLIEVEGVVSEEYNGEEALFIVESPDGEQKAYVRVLFEAGEGGGNWSVAIWPADEDIRSFEGRVDVRPAHLNPGETYRAYSSRLTLEVPDGTAVTNLIASEVE
jgi:hypothetical protein